MTATIDTTEILLKVALSTKVSLNVETSIDYHYCRLRHGFRGCVLCMSR